MPQNNKNENNVASGIKKKRGRPPKPKNADLLNEEVERVAMTDKGQISVQSQGSNSQTVQPLSYDAVSARWGQIFNKYANYDVAQIRGALIQNSIYGNRDSMLNPFLQNARIKQINAQGRKIDKSDMQSAIEDPENNEMTLQSTSWGLYYQNYIYNTLIKLNRDTPMYNYYVVPENMDESNYRRDDFKKEIKKVRSILEAFKVKETFKTISNQVFLEGKCAYLPRISFDDKKCNFAVMQKLNSSHIKLTGFGSEKRFLCSFDMSLFFNPEYSVLQYPPFIQKTWEEMLTRGIVTREDNKKGYKLNIKADLPEGHTLEWNEKYWAYWVQLPSELCEVFYSDGSHANVFPDFIGLMPDLASLDDYKWLMSTLAGQSVNTILTAEVPMIKELKAGGDQTALSPDTVLGYQDLAEQVLGGTVLPFFAPLTDFELHSIETSPDSLNIVYDRVRDLIATSNNSALLSISEKPSIASVKCAQLLKEASVDYLTRQFEDFLNRLINNSFELNYRWTVKIWGGIFTYTDEMKLMKEAILSGVRGLMPRFLSGFDMHLEDYKAIDTYMDVLGVRIIKDESKFNAEQNEYMTRLGYELDAEYNTDGSSSDPSVSNTKVDTSNEELPGLKNPVGRPKNENPDSEATENSQNQGSDVTEIKTMATDLAEFVLGDFDDEYKKSALEEIFQEEGLAEEVT